MKPASQTHKSTSAAIHPMRWARRVLDGGGDGDKPDPTSCDVWRWTKPKYRTRSVMLLLVNAILFAGLGCFTYWLRTGELNPFATEDYWGQIGAAFDPTRDQQVTLIDFLIYPIPAQRVPMMRIVIALVLASLTAIPILVSMLYRFPFSLIFTAIVAFVAVVPWLAITVTFCCYLARWKPLRFSFRFATALIALSPTVLYYLQATRNASVVEFLPPIEVAKLYMPWVMALLAACLVMAIVLLIARIVNYRPGAIAPLLAVMFAVPVVLFEAAVGRDELYYRLLEARFGSGERACFPTQVDVGEVVERVVQERWALARQRDPHVDPQAIREQVESALAIELAIGQTSRGDVARRVALDFYDRREIAIDEARWFQERFPQSRYVPNAIFLEGRAIDMRLERELTRFQGKLVLRYYEDFPAEASRPVWRRLYTRFPDSPLASVAAYRLALLNARAGQIGEAITLLQDLVQRFGQAEATDAASTPWAGLSGFFSRTSPAGSLDVRPAVVAHEGDKLLAMLQANRVVDLEPEYEYPVLQRLFGLDPHHAYYRRNLEILLNDISRRPDYSATRLRDNIEVLHASLDPSMTRRMRELQLLIDRLADEGDGEAVARAKFELGAAYQQDNLLADAREVFVGLQDEHPNSPWAREAARRVASMAQADE